ncbi:MAG: serine hydrolase [Ginsengibacter sp.]
MKKFVRFSSLLFLLLMLFQQTAYSQFRTDKKLEKKLKEVIDSFHGTAGIYVRNLKTGTEVAINADTIFPTASIIKVPILVGMFKKIEEGVYTYHQQITYRDSMKRGGSGLMQFFKDSTKIDLSDAITLMITHSDNVAAVWCEKMAGGGKVINEWLEQNGFLSTRVNARTSGRETDNKQFGWGQTSPREMANLLVMIREGKAVSPTASERMYRIMNHVYWDEYALSQIPPYVQTASKQGMVDASRSELVMVNAPHGDYVFYIATKNNVDKRWVPDNEAWQLARSVSALLWKYFEPRSQWKPTTGVEKYRH